MMHMPRFTISEVAQKLDVEKDIARGLVKFLEAVFEAEPMGDRPSVSGRGRAEGVYEFRDGFEKRIEKRLEKAILTDS